MPDIKLNRMRAFELENLLQHVPHDITCTEPAPYTGTQDIDPNYPFSLAMTDQNPNANHPRYWKMQAKTGAAESYCWLVLNQPYYIPEVMVFGWNS